MTDTLERPFYFFDADRNLHIPDLHLIAHPGESIALLGANGIDISKMYDSFNQLDPLRQSAPIIRCVTRSGNLFPAFSAYENFFLAERRIFPYNKSQLIDKCNQFKARFGIEIDFNKPIGQLSPSERVLLEVVRACLTRLDVFLCDNLFSLLDTDARQIFIAIVQDLIAHNKTVLYLTTKWEFAVQVASRITLFSDRSYLGEATAEDAKKNPQHLLYLMSGRSLVEQYDESTDATNLINMLYSGAEYLSDNLELSDALSVVLQNVESIFSCTFCSIYLLNTADNKSYHHFTAHSRQAPLFTSDFLDRVLHDMPADQPYYSSIDDFNFSGQFVSPMPNVQAFICMPIVFKGNSYGMLTVFFDRPVLYDDKQYLYLKSFCREIAIIIETSRLMGNSVLLQESNHRIKNNLQIIINLIAIQQIFASQHPECSLETVLASIINRLQNIASVHEVLSSKEAGQSFTDLRKIIDSVLRGYSLDDIRIHVQSDPILVPYARAISISMVINELVTNSIKYAFPADFQAEKQIWIRCSRSDGKIQIAVSDNGKGIPEGISLESSTSIGFSIIQAIVKSDLHGTIQVRNTGHGTAALITLPELS